MHNGHFILFRTVAFLGVMMLISLMTPRVSHAEVAPSVALATCKSGLVALKNYPPYAGRSITCVYVAGYGRFGAYLASVSGESSKIPCNGFASYGPTPPGWIADCYLNGPPPAPDDSVCSTSDNNSPVDTTWAGKITTGFSICTKATDPVSGASVACKRSVSPKGAPTLDPYSGLWQTYVHVDASSSLCSDGKNTDGTIYDQNGTATALPKATVPTTAPPAPPKVCGGGSCYDPATDQYCATSGGQQFCVSGATGRSNAGACASKGDAALCVGSPSSPRPAPPPASPISDPPTAIRTSDKVTQADKTTGANQTVVVTVYAPPGVQVDTGQKTGDAVKPVEQWCATDETGVKHCVPKTDPGTAYCVTLGDGSKVCEPKDGKDKGTASGGQDCNAPPICSGDQPTCMVIDQQWLSRCRPRFGEDANGQPNWTKVGDADGAGYATTDTPRGSVVSEVDGPGMDALDTSGFAGNTCPALPSFEAFGQTYSFDQDLFCRWLSTLRSVILLVAAFVSARILASGGKG